MPMPNPGPAAVDTDGAQAIFSVAFDGAIICQAEYRCTTCATLVACCEALRLAIGGAPAERASALTFEELARQLPEVPAARRGRLRIALHALHLALQVQNSNCTRI
jgi:NifU-like protein involved in Fe-S cluster formation